MTYLKKTKLHCIAQSLIDGVPKLKDCNYSFHRGSEWLKWYVDEFCDDGFISYELYRSGSRFTIDKVLHLDSSFSSVIISSEVYKLDRFLSMFGDIC